jgi:drug/metabolite transporter (DMT)-like permease
MTPPARTARRPWIVAAAILTIVLWSSAFVAIRLAARTFAGGPLALLRFGVASLAFLAAATLRRPRVPSRHDLAGLFLVGLIGIAIYHAAVNEGERTVNAGTASLLVCTSPIFTALLAAAWLRERLGPRGIAGVVVGFAGAAILARGSGASLAAGRGTLLVLLAAIAQAIYFVLQKPLLARLTAFDVTAWSTWLGTAALLVFAPGLVRTLAVAPPSALLAGVYLGVFPAALANGLWAFVLAHVPAARASSWIFLVPPIAMGMGWLLLGETLTPAAIAGGTVALLGVAITQRARSGATVVPASEGSAAIDRTRPRRSGSPPSPTPASCAR